MLHVRDIMGNTCWSSTNNGLMESLFFFFFIFKVACFILFSLLITCHGFCLSIAADIKKSLSWYAKIFKGKKQKKDEILQKHAVSLIQSIASKKQRAIS